VLLANRVPADEPSPVASSCKRLDVMSFIRRTQRKEGGKEEGRKSNGLEKTRREQRKEKKFPFDRVDREV
jgi:hypothetical protein